MNFGRELQDFIAGFDAGWGMANRREEREWEREQRQMRREDHARVRERDAIGDDQWERSFDQSERKFGENIRQFDETGKRTDRQYEANQHQRGIQNTHTQIQLNQGQQRIDNQLIDDFTGGGLLPDDRRTVEGYDTWLEGSTGNGGVEDRHASLIQNESGGNWGASNSAVGSGGKVGHFGRLQFGQARLQDAKNAGVIPSGMTPQQFMNSPDAQRAVENWHFADIDRQAERLGLNQYLGQNIGGVQISPDAIRAMAHLGGVNGAKRFIESGGQYNPADVNGTRLSDYGSRHGNQRTAYMARGGVVPDEEDDELVTAQPRLNPPAQPQTALPEEGMPAPRYAQADTGQPTGGGTQHIVDPYERGVQAALDGLRRAQELSNIHTQEVLDTPEVQRAREAYLRGYGAAPQQVIRQAQDRIDPERTMPASERNIRAIGSAWQYFMDAGEYDKAQQVAASMVQAMRQEEQKYSAVAAAAAEQGDLDTAMRAAMTAYANVPNGLDLDITPNEDGTYTVAITEQRSQNVVTEQTMNPREIAALAMNRDIGGFDDWILDAAGLAGARFDAPSLSDSRSTEMGASEAVEMQLAEAGLTPQQMEDIRDIASGIAGIEQNMGPGAAVSFVTSLFAPNPDDPQDQTYNFEIHDVPGDRTHKLIVSNGRQVFIPTNQAQQLRQARDGVAAARRSSLEADIEHNEYWGGVVDKGIEAAKGFGGLLGLPGGMAADTLARSVENNPRDLSALPVQEVEDQPAANPYGALPLPGEDVEAEIQRLLEIRERLLSSPELRTDDNNYDTLLRRTEDMLRDLGYDVGQ